MKISIITNFGCHFACPYCITKTANLDFNKTSVNDLDNLINVIEQNKETCEGLTIGGGGDPLFNVKENSKFYDKLFEIANITKMKIDLHTSLILPSSLDHFYHADKFNRLAFHLNIFKELYSIERKSEKQKIRVTFVADPSTINENLLFKISDFVKNNDTIDELSFRQRIMPDGSSSFYLDDILKKYDGKLWKYIIQDDYHLYYHANKIYTKFLNDFSKNK